MTIVAHYGLMSRLAPTGSLDLELVGFSDWAVDCDRGKVLPITFQHLVSPLEAHSVGSLPNRHMK